MAERKKNRAAVVLGRRGGRKRGRAWRLVPPAERSAIMRRVVEARWAKREGQPQAA